MNNHFKYRDPTGHFPVLVPAIIMLGGGLINTGVDLFVATRVQHQEYSFERAAVSFTVGASATGPAMVFAPAAAEVAVAATGVTEGTVSALVVKAVATGAVNGTVNVATQGAQTAGTELVKGASIQDSLASGGSHIAEFGPADMAFGFGQEFLKLASRQH